MTRLGLDTQESKALISVIVADVYAFIYPDVNTKDTTFNLFYLPVSTFWQQHFDVRFREKGIKSEKTRKE